MRYRSYKSYKKKTSIAKWLILLLVFGIVFILLAESRMSPVISAIARQRAHTVAMDLIQETVNEQFASMSSSAYQEIMYVEKDNNGRIILMMPDTIKINMIVSSLVMNIEKRLLTIESEYLSIPLGVVTGSKIFAGWGPKIKVRTRPVSAIHIEVLDDFIEAGINQTRHRIWLQISTVMTIAVPFSKSDIDVSTSVLLCEGIIIGPVPNTYLNLTR